MVWGFYGRTDELRATAQILGRNRWFFAKMTGRRRIGKTTLIQQAIRTAAHPVLYVQIPDSAPAGVLSAVNDALESFDVPADAFPRPKTLAEFARLIGTMARAGYAVILDEFQYFNRAHLEPFCSSLQAEVDTLSAQADRVPGGLKPDDNARDVAHEKAKVKYPAAAKASEPIVIYPLARPGAPGLSVVQQPAKGDAVKSGDD